MTSPAIATPPLEAAPRGFLARRLYGLLLRHVYLLTGSWPRLVEMLYWPIINMASWGFTSLYVLRKFNNSFAVSGIFVAGVLLNEFFFRTIVGMMLLFLEEVWSRNLGHLFTSPLNFIDYMIGVLGLSFLRTVISVSLAVVVASYLFGFSLLSLGWPLTMYLLLLLVSGWWYGMLIIALLLRFGMAAEWTAWMFTWLIIPLIAPYYPVAILPGWLQLVSCTLPPTYVFESMKSQIAGNGLRMDYLLISFVLNIVYFIAASLILNRAYQGARKRGGLLQMGE